MGTMSIQEGWLGEMGTYHKSYLATASTLDSRVSKESKIGLILPVVLVLSNKSYFLWMPDYQQ